MNSNLISTKCFGDRQTQAFKVWVNSLSRKYGYSHMRQDRSIFDLGSSNYRLSSLQVTCGPNPFG